MTNAAPVVATFEATSATMLRDLAERLDRSPESIVAEAVAGYVAEQTEFLDSLDEAEREIERGEYYTQEEMEAWFAERHTRIIKAA